MKKALFICLIFMFPASLWAEDQFYLYSRSYPTPQQGSVTLESGTAVGVRSTRPFGEDGYEQRLGASVGITNWLSAKGIGGSAWNHDGDYIGTLGSVEILAQVLNAKKHAVDVSLGVGYTYDYSDTQIFLSRLLLGRDFGNLNLTLNGLIEKPFSSERDTVDLMTSLGGSYQLNVWLRLGLELAGEDLEGFWEEEEAEGGARMLLGPTLRLTHPHYQKLQILPSFAWAYHLTRNSPAFSESTIQTEQGYIGRIAVIYTF